MKKINVAAYGVANATQNEVQTLNGGFFWMLAAGAAGWYLGDKYATEIRDFTKGLFRGANDGVQ